MTQFFQTNGQFFVSVLSFSGPAFDGRQNGTDGIHHSQQTVGNVVGQTKLTVPQSHQQVLADVRDSFKFGEREEP